MGKQVKYIEFNEAGIGAIEAGPDQWERLEEFIERVGGGEFHKVISWNEALRRMTLARCVDGRIPKASAGPLVPNAAGGTQSLFVADDLTTKRFAGDDNSTVAGYSNVIHFLLETGYEVGGHTDSHAKDLASGCGANDKLAAIYQYIDQRRDTLRAVAAQLGVVVPEDTHRFIAGNAASRVQFSSGKELLAVLEKNARAEFVDTLTGDHKEVIAIINMRVGTTLDRAALRAEFGPGYQAFNVDVWAFGEATRIISRSEDEAQQKMLAMLYYNLATAFVLSGPQMRAIQLADTLVA